MAGGAQLELLGALRAAFSRYVGELHAALLVAAPSVAPAAGLSKNYSSCVPPPLAHSAAPRSSRRRRRRQWR